MSTDNLEKDVIDSCAQARILTYGKHNVMTDMCLFQP